MSLGSTVRRQGFWTVDRMRGGPVRRQYQDVRASLSAASSPQDRQLQVLLAHASGTTKAYAPYAGLGLDRFPVTGKSAIKADPTAFRSSDYSAAALHTKTTSGSTGSPFSIDQDAGKRRRAIADTILFNEMAGQQVGDRLMWLFAVRLLPMPVSKRFIQNIVPVDHVGLDDRAREDIIETLRRKHVHGILTLPSTLWMLARHIERRGGAPSDLAVRSILSTGETLSPEVRRRIQDAFRCPVTNRYANEENGVLASTAPGEDLFVLNRASYVFEFLKPDSDEPEVPGKLARIVLTDLHNRAMPMIRYDTGDLAIVAETDGDQARTIGSVEGRRSDLIADTSGNPVSGPTVSGLMAMRVPDIAQFQLVQVDATSYILRVVLGTVDHDDAELAEPLREVLGADARVEVQIVKSIANGPTGKVRTIVPAGTGDASQA